MLSCRCGCDSFNRDLTFPKAREEKAVGKFLRAAVKPVSISHTTESMLAGDTNMVFQSP